MKISYSDLVRGGRATLVCRVIIPGVSVTIDRYRYDGKTFFAVRKYSLKKESFFLTKNSTEVNLGEVLDEEFAENQLWKIVLVFHKLTEKHLKDQHDFLVQVPRRDVSEFLRTGTLHI